MSLEHAHPTPTTVGAARARRSRSGAGGSLSTRLPSRCRFHPSCSAYALEALERHGAARGSWLAVRRIGRCHPWHPGGLDPVPPAHEPNVRSPREAV